MQIRHFIAGGRGRGLVALLLVLALPVVGDAADLTELRQQLATAKKKKDTELFARIAEQIAQEGSATAAEILIEDGLLSGDPVLETSTREILAKLPSGPALDWLCTQCTQHERTEVRDQLVGLLGPRRERNAFTAVLTCLYDPSDPVKVAAIIALEQKDHRGAIPHLIKALEFQEERERELGQIANELRRVLNRWTGKELFGSGEYQRLWKSHRDELLDPANKKKKDPLGEIVWEKRGTGVHARVPRFFGMEILSQQVVFVLDTSISMKAEDPPPPEEQEPGTEGDGKGGGTTVGGGGDSRKGRERPKHRGSRQRLKRVQNELVRLISDLPANFKFNVVSFDQEVSTFSKGLQLASPKVKRQAISFVRGFEADGETWTDRALEAAFDTPGVRTIVLLSDGMPYRKVDKIHVPTLLDWVDERNRFAHIEIHTIGFEQTSGEVGGFLRELSRRNRGKYTEIP